MRPVIICVDDDQTVLDSLMRELSVNLGDQFEIEMAMGGIEALELVDDLLSEEYQIALVISDYIMPDMKGDEVLRRIHERSPNTLKIMLTGQATIEGVSNAVNFAQLYRYIAKPWESIQLNLTLQEALKIYWLEHQLAEQNNQLRASEHRLAQFLEAIPIGVSVYDTTGKTTYANRKAKELLGIEVLPEMTIEQLSPAYQVYRAGTGQLYPNKELPVVRSLAGETVHAEDLELHHPDRIIPLEVSTTPISNEMGNITYAICTFQDITDRQRAESDRLRLAQEREAKNVALQMNREIEAKNQELASALAELQATQQHLIESEKMAALGQLVAGVAHEINTPIAAIRSSAGSISSFLSPTIELLPALFQTLTEEQGQEFLALLGRSLNQASTLSTKEERKLKKALRIQLQELEFSETDAENFADTLVIMGIYNEIDVFLPLFTRPDGFNVLELAYKLSQIKRGMTTIQTATERASKVVFALKTYAHYEQSGQMTQGNLIEGIETVLTLYQNQFKQGVNVIKNYAELPPILCYPDELNQVWTNLIHNALQAMDNRGTLTIDVIVMDDRAKISFTDSGKGIPEEIKSKIFVPFFTTKPPGEGSGLGLDIINKIIVKHQGKIEFESIPGETIFNVFLPMSQR
ncbi:ATP-binding protein [Tychonema sp. BBK16]|uniref:ATP-binding protein n=1 Tax=Tychonema sp. BBK16 TaxID=2699888 RepID=UPI001F2E66F3|nr:ATP-binding protein [Tychonema sp. BBK16]MCF6375000.1 ATP-binding protein [Tychonema sp. BBK16]